MAATPRALQPAGRRERRGWLFTNRFAVLALLCIAGLALAMAVALSSLLARAVSDWEWENTATLVRREIDRARLAPLFARAPGPESTERWARDISQLFAGIPEVTRIKVWNPEATVLWSDETRLIGQRFLDNRELQVALAGRVEVEIKTLTGAENLYEPRGARLAEIYVPIFAANPGPVVGVIEIYKTPVRLFATIDRGERLIWSISLVGGVILYLILLPLVSEVYGRQVREEVLREQAEQLEREVAKRTQDLRETNVRLVEADRVKSRFLASVSHELRTPLNSILGFARVLLKGMDGELTERQVGSLRAVEKSGTYLLQLVTTVLEASRLDAGNVELQPQPFDPRVLVEECVDAARILAGGKPVTIESEVAADVATLHADRVAVKQILLNLLSNAVKFTPQGRVLVQVRLEPGRAHILVQDTGVGIRPEDVHRVFEPFVRLEPGVETDEGGSGLGLAVTKRLVELHGGRVWVESRQYAGSTFHLTLPQPGPASGEPPPLATGERGERGRGPG
jgi:signal transduction histidine kinase